jgi:hypothetical protein
MNVTRLAQAGTVWTGIIGAPEIGSLLKMIRGTVSNSGVVALQVVVTLTFKGEPFKIATSSGIAAGALGDFSFSVGAAGNAGTATDGQCVMGSLPADLGFSDSVTVSVDVAPAGGGSVDAVAVMWQPRGFRHLGGHKPE